MAFLQKADLYQDIYEEILQGIARANETKITTACNEAIDEAEGYLCGRYNTDDLFEKTAEDRNKTVLAICRTLAIYKLHRACNTMPELIMEEKVQAIKELDKIQSGKIILKGAKLLGETDEVKPDTVIKMTSNPKRNNSF